MKTITIYQPWASLIASGAKLFETRSWPTKHRGRIAIHAGMTPAHELDRQTRDAIATAFGWPPGMDTASYIRALPHGAVIATADLVGCHKIVSRTTISGGPSCASLYCGEDRRAIRGSEILFGDWTPGRYAWELANVEILPQPVPVRGKQGLWNWEEVNR